jgi:hypothetical protein
MTPVDFCLGIKYVKICVDFTWMPSMLVKQLWVGKLMIIKSGVVPVEISAGVSNVIWTVVKFDSNFVTLTVKFRFRVAENMEP